MSALQQKSEQTSSQNSQPNTNQFSSFWTRFVNSKLKLPAIFLLAVLLVFSMFFIGTVWRHFLVNQKMPGTCPSKDYSSNRQVQFSFGKVEYQGYLQSSLPSKEENLLGIYKFPEFDLYAYKKDEEENKQKAKNDLPDFLSNPLALPVQALSCYPPRMIEGGNYSLINNEPAKRFDFNILDLVRGQDFYVVKQGVANRLFTSGSRLYQPKLDSTFFVDSSDEPVILIEKSSGIVSHNLDKKPDKYLGIKGLSFVEENIDWQKISEEEKQILTKTRQEMETNFQFQTEQIKKAGCLSTIYYCNNAPVVSAPKANLLTAKMENSKHDLYAQPAQRVLDLSDPKNLKMEINLVFNYQQKSGKMRKMQNDCLNYKSMQESQKKPVETCKDNYELAEYKHAGKYKLVQIVATSQDLGKNWQAQKINQKEYLASEQSKAELEEKDSSSSDYLPISLLQETSYPLKDDQILEDPNELKMVSENSTIYRYPFQHKIWQE